MAPNSQYEPRFNQIDIRFSRRFQYRQVEVRPAHRHLQPDQLDDGARHRSAATAPPGCGRPTRCRRASSSSACRSTSNLNRVVAASATARVTARPGTDCGPRPRAHRPGLTHATGRQRRAVECRGPACRTFYGAAIVIDRVRGDGTRCQHGNALHSFALHRDPMKRTLRDILGLVDGLALVGSGLSARRAFAVSPAPPTFRFDPTWPKEMPNNWLVGNVVGVAVDSQDNVWITHRPNSQVAPTRRRRSLRSIQAATWCRAGAAPGAGYEWGTQAHGLYVDYKDNVWVGFGGGLPYDLKTKATTDNAHILKFTPAGKFLLQTRQVRARHRGQQQHARCSASRPTSPSIRQTNEAYITDGYTNQRVIVFDAKTGAYKRHWGAFGKKPDDAAMPPFSRTGTPRQQFDTPHCAALAKDGSGLHLRPRQPAHPGVPEGRHVRQGRAHQRQAGRRPDGRHALGHRLLHRSAADLHLPGRRRQSPGAHAAPRYARGGRAASAAAAASPGSSNRPTASPSIPRAICSSPRRSMAVACRSSSPNRPPRP